MYLAATGTLRGKAGTASVITYTIHTDEILSGADTFSPPAQSTLASTTGTLYTAPASTQTLITEIQLTSASGSNIPVTFYINGTAAGNIVWQGTIPANGSASYNGKGWTVYDSNGVFQSVGTTGPAGTITIGTVTNIGTTGPPTVTNVGTGIAAILNFGLQQGATGLTGSPGVVQDVLASDAGIVVGGTTAHPTVGYAQPFASRITAASKVWASSDRNKFYERINGGAAMTDTLPTLTNTVTDIGYTLNIHNKGTTVAETITFTGAGGEVIGDVATSYVLNFACRQTFIWTGTKWLFGAGNANLIKSPTSAPVAGNLMSFTDTTGRQSADSGLNSTNLVGTARTISTTAPLTGGGDLSANRTLALTTSPTGQTPVGVTRTLTTTAPLTGGGDLSADRTLAISAATTSTAGSLSATNFNNINNYFGHVVYNVEDYGVLPGNSAATNVTNMNTLLQTTAPDGAIIQFGPYTYSFNAGLTTLTKDFCIQGVYGQTTIAITAAMGAGVPWLNLWNSGFYSCVQNLNFVAFTANQASNYVIANNNNANSQFINLFFTGATTWAGILDFTGTSAGNGTVIRNLYAANFTGIAINISSALSTLFIEDILIVGGNSAVNTGIFCDNGGAMLMSGCQMIGCGINMNLTPATGKTVSAIYATNCFFDQGVVNCLKISGVGTGTVARCHYVGCWFTTSTVGSSPNNILINSTGTGIHAGIEFQCSWIMNANPGSTGTLTGINATAVQDLTVTSCQFAGWTNDVQITPASANTCAVMLTGNNFDTAGLISGSANNVTLNAGSFGYRSVNVNSNVFGGTTSKLVDNSTMSGVGVKNITGNAGLVQPGIVSAFATTRPNLTAAALNLVGGTSIQLPTNGLHVGSQLRFTVALDKTAAGVAAWTVKVKFGTANTTADAEIASWTSGTNTGAAEGANLVIDVNINSVGAAATCTAQATYQHNLLAATGLGSIAPAPTATTAFNSTAANPWMHIDITPGASAVMTAVGRAEVIV